MVFWLVLVNVKTLKMERWRGRVRGLDSLVMCITTSSYPNLCFLLPSPSPRPFGICGVVASHTKTEYLGPLPSPLPDRTRITIQHPGIVVDDKDVGSIRIHAWVSGERKVRLGEGYLMRVVWFWFGGRVRVLLKVKGEEGVG